MPSPIKADTTQKSLEQQIGERLGQFDLISLLRLLKSEGIDENAMWFSSHNSVASQNSLIESVKIVQNNAFIEVNIGILAPTGILPGYIRQFMDRPDADDQGLQHLFKLFDHVLISSYLAQLYPEINRCFFADWHKTKRCYTKLQNMRSESSLHWLFETAFPEFNVKLNRLNYAQKRCPETPKLGRITLGDKAQSSTVNLMKDSFKVMLYLRPELISSSLNWSQTVKSRLVDWVFPWLSDFSTYLDIHLFTHFFGTHLKLFDRSALGYDPFRQHSGDKADNAMHQWLHHSLIFADNVPADTTPVNMLSWEDSGRIRV